MMRSHCRQQYSTARVLGANKFGGIARWLDRYPPALSLCAHPTTGTDGDFPQCQHAQPQLRHWLDQPAPDSHRPATRRGGRPCVFGLCSARVALEASLTSRKRFGTWVIAPKTNLERIGILQMHARPTLHNGLVCPSTPIALALP
jgi:hypothetical protein